MESWKRKSYTVSQKYAFNLSRIYSGISGEKGKGVFAIIIADGGYKNEQLTADEAISSNTGDVSYHHSIFHYVWLSGFTDYSTGNMVLWHRV